MTDTTTMNSERESLHFDVALDQGACELLYALLAPSTPDDKEYSEVRLQIGDGHSGFGLYVSSAEYPEEGSELLCAIDQQPAAVPHSAAAAQPVALTFAQFREANRTRCLRWHPQGIESWSDSDWITAIVGELGELASLIKMRNRERDGLSGNKFSPTNEQIAKEAADVFTYLDLFCERNGIDLGLSAVQKFNEVSERVGFPDRIELNATPPAAPEPVLACGHPGSLMLKSAETGADLYCELCDARQRARDAEATEAELRERVAQLEAALRELLNATDPDGETSAQGWLDAWAVARAILAGTQERST